MNPTATRRITYTWVVLSAITVASWLLARTDDGAHLNPSTPITVTVLVLALLKIRLVLRSFAEVRTAPRWLHLFTDLWLAALGITVLALYLA